MRGEVERQGKFAGEVGEAGAGGGVEAVRTGTRNGWRVVVGDERPQSLADGFGAVALLGVDPAVGGQQASGVEPVRQLGRVAMSMAPGFVTDTQLEDPDTRLVTFVNGDVARERLIARDASARRIVWAFTDGWAQPIHNNSAMQIHADGDHRSRLVWTHDVLPDNLAERLAAAMDGGLPLIKQTIEKRAA